MWTRILGLWDPGIGERNAAGADGADGKQPGSGKLSTRAGAAEVLLVLISGGNREFGGDFSLFRLAPRLFGFQTALVEFRRPICTGPSGENEISTRAGILFATIPKAPKS